MWHHAQPASPRSVICRQATSRALAASCKSSPPSSEKSCAHSGMARTTLMGSSRYSQRLGILTPCFDLRDPRVLSSPLVGPLHPGRKVHVATGSLPPHVIGGWEGGAGWRETASCGSWVGQESSSRPHAVRYRVGTSLPWRERSRTCGYSSPGRYRRSGTSGLCLACASPPFCRPGSARKARHPPNGCLATRSCSDLPSGCVSSRGRPPAKRRR